MGLEDLENDLDQDYKKARTWLVEGWQRALRWWSVQASVLAVVLEALKLWLNDNTGSIALITQQGWYSFVVFAITIAIPLLRLVKQPVPTPPATGAPAKVPNDETAAEKTARLSDGS